MSTAWLFFRPLKPAGEIVLFFLIGQLSTEDKGAGGGGGKGGPGGGGAGGGGDIVPIYGTTSKTIYNLL